MPVQKDSPGSAIRHGYFNIQKKTKKGRQYTRDSERASEKTRLNTNLNLN